MTVPSYCKNAPAAVRNAKEASFQVQGAKLFNVMPKHLRNSDGSANTFVKDLDSWLETIPDQPMIQARQRAVAINSILDQVNYAEQ